MKKEVTNKCHYCELPATEFVDVPQPDATKFRVYFCEEHFLVFAKKARSYAEMNAWMANITRLN